MMTDGTDEFVSQIAKLVSMEIASRREMTFLEQLEIMRLQALFEGWKAENKARELRGENILYEEAHFWGFADQIQQVQNHYIDELKRQRTRKGRSR